MTAYHGEDAMGAIPKQDPQECRVCLKKLDRQPYWLRSMYLCSEICLRDNN